MAQRISGFARRAGDDYPTPSAPVKALIPFIQPRALHIWDPCMGDGYLVKALRDAGFEASGTADDFLLRTKLPTDQIQALATSPPYGSQGRVAASFIRHALTLPIPLIVLLLPIDYDSAITRPDLFRDCEFFAGKIILLGRVRFFPGESSPSSNHAWFHWSRSHVGPPTISYARCKTEDPS
jgi:hypothetical protein